MSTTERCFTTNYILTKHNLPKLTKAQEKALVNETLVRYFERLELINEYELSVVNENED